CLLALRVLFLLFDAFRGVFAVEEGVVDVPPGFEGREEQAIARVFDRLEERARIELASLVERAASDVDATRREAAQQGRREEHSACAARVRGERLLRLGLDASEEVRRAPDAIHAEALAIRDGAGKPRMHLLGGLLRVRVVGVVRTVERVE